MKEKLASELNKISNMDRAQKWDYFKSYYLVKTILLAVGLIMLIWFIKDTAFQKKIANAGCVYGIELSEAEANKLTEGYLDYYKYNKKKYAAYISTDNMFEGTEQQMDANAHEMALIAQIAAGEIYYLILDRESLDIMQNSGTYYALDGLFADGIPQRFKDSGISFKDEETGETYIGAIDLNKAGLFEGREGYLVFTVGIPDSDYPVRFLKFIESM